MRCVPSLHYMVFHSMCVIFVCPAHIITALKLQKLMKHILRTCASNAVAKASDQTELGDAGTNSQSAGHGCGRQHRRASKAKCFLVPIVWSNGGRVSYSRIDICLAAQKEKLQLAEAENRRLKDDLERTKSRLTSLQEQAQSVH